MHRALADFALQHAAVGLWLLARKAPVREHAVGIEFGVLDQYLAGKRALKRHAVFCGIGAAARAVIGQFDDRHYEAILVMDAAQLDETRLYQLVRHIAEPVATVVLELQRMAQFLRKGPRLLEDALHFGTSLAPPRKPALVVFDKRSFPRAGLGLRRDAKDAILKFRIGRIDQEIVGNAQGYRPRGVQGKQPAPMPAFAQANIMRCSAEFAEFRKHFFPRMVFHTMPSGHLH